MSQINKITMAGLLLVAGLQFTVGCGSSTPNTKAPFDADSQKHSADWLHKGHSVAAQEDYNSCGECHWNYDGAGGISGVSCRSCHLNPFALTGCTSCHGNPPNGNAAPNRGGVHALHYTFLYGSGACGDCHNEAGSLTANHYNGTVEVNFTSNFNAKSGAAIRNSDGTCSNVSCHGGQTTPGWLSGTRIDVGTQCASCHVYGTTQFNSFSSGKHDVHVNDSHFPCTRCHDTVKLAQTHFRNLNTQSMEGPASDTIYSFLSYTYDAYGNRMCGAACHGPRIWN